MLMTDLIFSTISEQIALEAQQGYHVESITVSNRLDLAPFLSRYDCPVFGSASMQINEFCLSVRSSPSNRRVEFFRVTRKKVSP